MTALMVLLHVLGVVIWVGGMFFAYMALRPAAVAVLEPPQRLPLWRATFARFFPWVWGAIAAILLSGLHLVFSVYKGFAGLPVHLHVMFGLGLVMMAIFGHVFFACYRRLCRAVDAADWPAGGKALGQIRQLIQLNLILGLCNIVVVKLGPLW